MAYAFWFITNILMCIVPFFVAYYLSGADFWLKHNTYLEQPSVTYEAKSIVILEGTKNSRPLSLFFSTVSSLNGIFANNLRIPVFRSQEVDADHDGYVDQLQIQAAMPIMDDEDIYSAKLLTFYRYKLKKHAKLTTYMMGYSSHASPLSGESLMLDGDMVWKQTWPLRIYDAYEYPYSTLLDTDYLAPWTNGNRTYQNFIPSLITEYRSRNYTADITEQYTVWTGLGDSIRLATGEGRSFNLTATIRFPVQTITYSPTLPEVLLSAWIKYVCILSLVAVALSSLKNFAYNYQIFDTHIEFDQGPSRHINRFKTHRY